MQNYLWKEDFVLFTECVIKITDFESRKYFTVCSVFSTDISFAIRKTLNVNQYYLFKLNALLPSDVDHHITKCPATVRCKVVYN